MTPHLLNSPPRSRRVSSASVEVPPSHPALKTHRRTSSDNVILDPQLHNKPHSQARAKSRANSRAKSRTDSRENLNDEQISRENPKKSDESLNKSCESMKKSRESLHKSRESLQNLPLKESPVMWEILSERESPPRLPDTDSEDEMLLQGLSLSGRENNCEISDSQHKPVKQAAAFVIDGSDMNRMTPIEKKERPKDPEPVLGEVKELKPKRKRLGSKSFRKSQTRIKNKYDAMINSCECAV